MRNLSIDLISDLHVETWNEQFDWSGQPTSPSCIVAGDVAHDPKNLQNTLSNLAGSYQTVFYIEGNEEHKHSWIDIQDNVTEIKRICKSIPNVIYLHSNVVIANGIAVVGTNGWWTWDFDDRIDSMQSRQWFADVYPGANLGTTYDIDVQASVDVEYLYSAVESLQSRKDVEKIIVVSHTVPNYNFVKHDLSLQDTHRINVLGNSYIQTVLLADTERKISHWCFGHYHGQVDQTVHGVRYVTNPRGRGDTDFKQSVYFPKRIELN